MLTDETTDSCARNRLTKTLGGVTESYSYDDGDKLSSITSGGSTVKSFTYDTAGRTTSVTTSSGTTTLSYDYEDRVTGITYPNLTTNSFTYNGLDARVGKTDSGGTSAYRRDGASVLAPVLSDAGASYTPGISERRGSQTRFFHPDRLGTYSQLTSPALGSVAKRQYDAYGNLTSITGSTPTPFGFAGDWGYQEDADSGLKLLGHRYYDPSIGRFLTRDPIQDGRNWYTYCENNPTKWVDPTGLFNLGEALLAVWQLPTAVVGALVDCATGLETNLQPNMPDNGTTHGTWPIDAHVTFGPVMLHPSGSEMDEHTAAHEMIHQEQSKILGPFYLPLIIVSYVGAAVPGSVDWVTQPFRGGKRRPWMWTVHDYSPFEIAADIGADFATGRR